VYATRVAWLQVALPVSLLLHVVALPHENVNVQGGGGETKRGEGGEGGGGKKRGGGGGGN